MRNILEDRSKDTLTSEKSGFLMKCISRGRLDLSEDKANLGDALLGVIMRSLNEKISLGNVKKYISPSEYSEEDIKIYSKYQD